MNRIMLLCIFALFNTSVSLAQSNQTESLSFTTYYPAPYGVYRYLKLNPADSPPASPSPGMMYYDNSSDSIRYNNSINWVELSGGGGGGGNGTYWNRTGTGTPGDPYRLHNTNTGFVGIGTQNPQAPLTVQRTDVNPNNSEIVTVRKHYNGSAFPDQWIAFKAYPANVAGYLNSTSVMYTIADLPQNLEVLACNISQHIRFNIGNFTEPYSEIMRLVNPGMSKPMVGIGTTNPIFPLQIDANAYGIDAFGVRGTSDGLKTGFFNVFPWANSMDLAYGCYRSSGGWVNDPFDYVEYGVTKKNHTYAKLVLLGTYVYWYAGNSITGNNQIPYSGPPAGGFNLAFEQKLWGPDGTWMNCVCPPSSRKLKENFVTIKSADILRSIDRLDVSRWNYKSKDKSDHIGPMAEDFYRIFKTGSREDELNLIDSVGVSLAGVKALSEKIKTQEQEIEELEGDIRGLRAQLSK